ncbi:hypothetical protein MUG91_G20n146 [Manis pentadactyla]|nr:hypothetical protein MUG91_G20n146 [Manis pentadactyla]
MVQRTSSSEKLPGCITWEGKECGGTLKIAGCLYYWKKKFGDFKSPPVLIRSHKEKFLRLKVCERILNLPSPGGRVGNEKVYCTVSWRQNICWQRQGRRTRCSIFLMNIRREVLVNLLPVKSGSLSASKIPALGKHQMVHDKANRGSRCPGDDLAHIRCLESACQIGSYQTKNQHKKMSLPKLFENNFIAHNYLE